MAFADYAIRSYRGSNLVRGIEKGSIWAYRLAGKRSASVTLEEEIYILRRKMEQMASCEQSLTDPKVIELSVMLDRVLNDYMNVQARA